VVFLVVHVWQVIMILGRHVELAIILALLVMKKVQAIVKLVIPLLDNYLLVNVRVKLDTMIMVSVKPV